MPSINLINIKMTILGNTDKWTRGFWVRSSVLCRRPPPPPKTTIILEQKTSPLTRQFSSRACGAASWCSLRRKRRRRRTFRAQGTRESEKPSGTRKIRLNGGSDRIQRVGRRREEPFRGLQTWASWTAAGSSWSQRWVYRTTSTAGGTSRQRRRSIRRHFRWDSHPAD